MLDDIKTVSNLLERACSYKESDEVTFERYNNLKSAYDEAVRAFSEYSYDDSRITNIYSTLTNAFLCFESNCTKYDTKCMKSVMSRLKVKEVSYSLLGSKSKLLFSSEYLGVGGITPSDIRKIHILSYEAMTIGFRLNNEEEDLLYSVSEVLSKL